MQHRKIYTLIGATGILLLVAIGFWLATTTPARAQCGSQASSCKNCHEVQGELPVNGDGTAWHTSHAFGDFCYICHAGNNQAKDKAEAHTGMVPPLSDIQASCLQCHPNDLQERAQVYASTLGVEVGSEAASPANEPAANEGETASPVASSSMPSATAVELDDPNLVDFTQRYNEIVLGEKPINWGNAILIGMIGLLVVGGGGFVVHNEKLVKVSFGDTKKASDEYPADVIDLLPAIAGLKLKSRLALKNLINNPQRAEKILGLIEAVVSDEKNEERL